MTSAQSNALHALLTLIQLEHRFRWATPEEARFIAVNDLYRIIPYKQAILFEWNRVFPAGAKAAAASGIVQVDQDSPVVRGLAELNKAFLDALPEKPVDVPAPEGDAFAGEKIVAVPVTGPKAAKQGVLYLVRSQPFTASELSMLEKIGDALAGALNAGSGFDPLGAVTRFFKDRKKRQLFLLGLAVFLLFPVRASVLAPAEIVPEKPVIIRAPLQGVIGSIPVEPNQQVEEGDVLLTFDREELAARADVARQGMASASAELRQASLQAMDDSDARMRIAAIQGRLDKERTNLAYAESLLARSEVSAPGPGVVVFDNVYDWIGQNVSLGEKIMLLADPAKTQLEIRLPVNDAIALPEKARILFFSNAAPHRPHKARLSLYGYRAAQDEYNTLSYRLEASWTNPDAELRLGSAGTAKLYGAWRPLVWQIFRKPLASLRSFTGL